MQPMSKHNHFAVKCQQNSQVASVKVVDEQDSDEEVHYTSALTVMPMTFN